MVIDPCRYCSLKGEFSSAKNWAEGSTFPMVSFCLTLSIDFKVPLGQLSFNVIPPPNSEWLLRSFAFNMFLPIEIIIFREITAPDGLILTIVSFIFTSNSSPTNKVCLFCWTFLVVPLPLPVDYRTYASNCWQF